MARIEQDYTATVGRDKGKVFHITEMSARAGHSWALRTMLALANSGVEIDDEIMARGMAGLATLALDAVAKIRSEAAEPLLDELLSCVTINHGNGSRKLIDDDFEEISTIFMLQKEVFMVHIAPFTTGGA